MGDAAEKRLRYAICKEPDRLNRETLQRFAQSLQPPFLLRRFDRDLYEQAMAESWSRIFAACFGILLIFNAVAWVWVWFWMASW